MKFRKIFALEFGYQFRRAATWLYFGFIFILSWLWVVANYSYDAKEGYFLLNAPVVIAAVTVLSCVMWLLTGASVAGDAATRDVHTRMFSMTYTAPSGKAAYLGGRFIAAFTINMLVLSAIPAGILVAMYFSGVESDILGPFQVAPYFITFFYLILPNAFFATAVQFSVATLGRRAMGSYIGGAILFVTTYFISQALRWKGDWGNIIDPMRFTPVMSYLSIWSPLEKHSRMVMTEDSFFESRILWLFISLGMLAFTYFRFRFVLPEARRKSRQVKNANPGIAAREPFQRQTPEPLPIARGTYCLSTQLQQLRLITWKSFLQIAKNKVGLPFLALLALLVAAAMPGNMDAKNVPLLPRTDRVLDYLTAPLTAPNTFWIIIVLLLIYYAGELVWRERETGMSEIANAAPVPEWLLFLGRFLAMGLVMVIWMIFLMMAGMAGQAGIGGARIEIGLYLKVLFGLQLVDCLLFALLALLIHVLVNHKFIGHLAALVVYGLIAFAANLGIEHKLLIFSASTGWTYTDMAGFGPGLQPWLWFKVYWIAWSLLLAVVVKLFWVRGRETNLIPRLKLARLRFNRSAEMVTAIAVTGILVSGGFIFYNMNVLHNYRNSSAVMKQRADYELLYRQYFNLPQPQLRSVNLQVEIYPEQRAVEIEGNYLLVNNTDVPIDSIYLAAGEGVRTAAIKFDRPFKEVMVDTNHRFNIYNLVKPITPGDSLHLTFSVSYKAHGFSNSGADLKVIQNGTSFRNIEWLPVIGYQPYRELDEAGARKTYGLVPRPTTPSLYDTNAHHYAPFLEQIDFEAVVGTDADQLVVAPGTLRRRWTKDKRSYFHYVTDAPIRNEYSFFSANYEVKKGKWGGPEQEVSIEIFYPPGSRENPERMVKSAQASLDYYTKQFGAYPHRQLRFVAHPGYGFGNHASPINITAEEGFFLMNPKDDPRGLDLVSAVVAHEVAHQWWGNQLKAASVEGAGLITESLAWYSAMGVMEDQYGTDYLDRLLKFLREEYETPRTRAALPLLQANDWYQYYRKGPFAMYTLSQYIGRDKVNAALRNLLANHPPGTRPFATSIDLYRELEAVTPDTLQYLLNDLFRANTFWELEMEGASVKPIKAGKWQLTIDLKAKKLVVDSMGAEKVLPMKELIEIGIFASAENKKNDESHLRLQKQLITSGSQTITLTVNEKPYKVGIDPRHLMVDWKLVDNYKGVEMIK
jgi:ABC-2 type transport system permease protein